MLRYRLLGAAFLSVALWGCSEITAPRLLTTFEWGEVPEPETLTEGISTAVALGDLFIVGEFPTATRCFEPTPDFDRDGDRVTLRVDATRTSAPNCAESPGGYRYTASITNLDHGTYTLRVIHAATDRTFTESVTIR